MGYVMNVLLISGKILAVIGVSVLVWRCRERIGRVVSCCSELSRLINRPIDCL